MNPIQYRNQQARQLPEETGVYALCDLDETPIYVGQSQDGIRARVRRHLTSARSDVIANRQLDIWEIAYVWAWPVARRRKADDSGRKRITDAEIGQIELLERALYHKFDRNSPLINGTVVPPLAPSERTQLQMPDVIRLQIMTPEEIATRLDPARRLPRQADHFRNLIDHMLNVKNEDELRRALKAHFDRLTRYTSAFLAATRTTSSAGGEGTEDD